MAFKGNFTIIIKQQLQNKFKFKASLISYLKVPGCMNSSQSERSVESGRGKKHQYRVLFIINFDT